MKSADSIPGGGRSCIVENKLPSKSVTADGRVERRARVVRLWFKSIVPIHVGAEKAAEEHRNPNCIGAVLWSGFEQEHADRQFPQPGETARNVTVT